MNFPKNAIDRFKKGNNAGGMENVLPTPCLPAAYVSAYFAARAAGTGRAKTSDVKGGRSTRPVVEKNPILHLELAA